MKMMRYRTLDTILKDYRSLPEYIGFEEIDINTEGDFSDYPIHIAAVRGDIADIQVLYKNGADINSKGEHQYTPLHNAIEQGHYDTVKYLLGLGVDRKAKTDDGLTPLELAKILNYKEVVVLLS